MHPDMKAIRCSIVRGGTSKGVYFLEHDLPKDPALRDKVTSIGINKRSIDVTDTIAGLSMGRI